MAAVLAERFTGSGRPQSDAKGGAQEISLLVGRSGMGYHLCLQVRPPFPLMLVIQRKLQ